MKIYPTFNQAVLLLVLLWSIETALAIIAPVVLFEIGLNRPTRPELVLIIGSVVGCLVAWWGWRKTGARFGLVFPLSRIRLVVYIPVMLTVIGGGIVISEIDNLFRVLLPIPDAMAQAFGVLGDDASLAFLILGPVLSASILEEGLFRGLILYGFLRNYPLKKALIFSALLFSVLHMNPWQFVGAFIMGIVFGWWYHRTQSLWPCIVGHILNNSIATLFFHFDFPGLIAKTDFSKPVEFQPWWLDLMGLLFMFLGLWWFHRVSNSRLPDAPNGVVEVNKVVAKA